MLQPMEPSLPSLRVLPEDWLGPLALDRYFGNVGPVEVDLGCGKGRFLLARARRHPHIHFLGIDRMLRRIRKVDNKARRAGLGNVRLLRMEGYYAVSYLLPEGGVSAYYILFPDPWPKQRHHDHRLFNPAFVRALHRTLAAGGRVHVATDHLAYFEEIRAGILASGGFREVEPFVPDEEEQTDFERYYVGRKPIGRASFKAVPGWDGPRA